MSYHLFEKKRRKNLHGKVRNIVTDFLSEQIIASSFEFLDQSALTLQVDLAIFAMLLV